MEGIAIAIAMHIATPSSPRSLLLSRAFSPQGDDRSLLLFGVNLATRQGRFN